ncbi:hypothetical protein MLD52_11525 [Puniceicoccaceae bacterium K14]|nr:hypothetical protein [Puniceicoccaceae bacterium K14]
MNDKSMITPETFWGLTVFFNPQGYENRGSHYQTFRKASKQQGLKLLTVELAFGDQDFELEEKDADKLVQIRASEENVMWQKERLLNIGLDHLPSDCNAFAWLDCDILFQNSNWIGDTVDRLTEYPVVQPFELSLRLRPGEVTVDVESANDPLYEKRHGVGYSYAHRDLLNDYLLIGHSGFAWAARRSIFDDIGFYDKMIVGGADTVLACGFFGRDTHKFTHILPAELVEHQRSWIDSMKERVQGTVSYSPGAIFHLWHGESRHRRTEDRLRLFAEHDYNPERDVWAEKGDCFSWSNEKKGLKEAVSHYFWLRNEDGDPERNKEFEENDFDKKTRESEVSLTKERERKQRFLLQAKSVNSDSLKGQRMTLVIMNWKRPFIVKEIVNTYLKYGLISDAVVWNNNLESDIDFEGDSRVKVVNCKHDAGLDSRWAAAALADEENILIHDDDLIVPEKSLEVLFAEYCKRPELSHGFIGRNISNEYSLKDAYGDVDIVLTRCLIMKKQYITDYFRFLPEFDHIRSYDCGNGEDIIMNYVIRHSTGCMNMAHYIPYSDFSTEPEIIEESVSARPLHVPVRNEICRHAMEILSEEEPRLRIMDYGLHQLSVLFPAPWVGYYKDPSSILKAEYFQVSESVKEDKFLAALSFLCRAKVEKGTMPMEDLYRGINELSVSY